MKRWTKDDYFAAACANDLWATTATGGGPNACKMCDEANFDLFKELYVQAEHMVDVGVDAALVAAQLGAELADLPGPSPEARKNCAKCGKQFKREPDCTDAQWENFKFCSIKCADPRPIKIEGSTRPQKFCPRCASAFYRYDGTDVEWNARTLCPRCAAVTEKPGDLLNLGTVDPTDWNYRMCMEQTAIDIRAAMKKANLTIFPLAAKLKWAPERVLRWIDGSMATAPVGGKLADDAFLKDLVAIGLALGCRWDLQIAKV